MLNFAPTPFIFAKNSNSLRPDNPIGHPFINLEAVGSTNNYAMGQAQAQLAGHGATWFTHHQLHGKGQRGKQWIANAGDSIIMSCLVTTPEAVKRFPFLLGATAAMACFDFFSRYAGDETSVKWPNDLYWRERKAGGILIENVWQGMDWKYAVVGIGINVNQGSFPNDIPNPVSLRQITGKLFEAETLAKELCHDFENRWQLLKQNNSEEVMNAYNQVLFKKDQKVAFKKETARMEAVVKGVNKNGELLIDTGSVVSSIPYGEIEWLIS